MFFYTTELARVIFRQMLIVTVCSHRFLNQKCLIPFHRKSSKFLKKESIWHCTSRIPKRLITLYFFA